jgi:hypothetical protein
MDLFLQENKKEIPIEEMKTKISDIRTKYMVFLEGLRDATLSIVKTEIEAAR